MNYQVMRSLKPGWELLFTGSKAECEAFVASLHNQANLFIFKT